MEDFCVAQTVKYKQAGTIIMSASSSVQITRPICITQGLFYCVVCLIQADGGVF